MGAYDPHSIDAMFSRIMQRLDTQDLRAAEHRTEIKAALEEIHSDVRQAHGRVGKLEVWRNEIRAKVAVVSTAISIAVSAAWQWWLNRNSGH